MPCATGEDAFRLLQRMSRPELWRLQDTLDIAATLEESLLNDIGLMPYNDGSRGWCQRVRSSQDMLNHRMPSCGV